jgi:antirestriction protein ArdC
MAKRDIYQEITDEIIGLMETGINPVRVRWDGVGSISLPINHSTGNHYNGINILLLWVSQERSGFSSSHWMTYKQAKAAGGQVRKDEKGTNIIFYKTLEKDTGEIDSNGSVIIESIPMLRTFTTFNLDQIEGIESPTLLTTGTGFEPDLLAEEILNTSGVEIVEEGTRAMYRPSTDTIYMPTRDRFSKAEDYYATALHELAHATKAKQRCDRPRYESDIRGARAFEELVAEIGSAFLMAGLSLPGLNQDHADYVGNWLEVLKSDKRAIFKAAAQARKAHDWIMQAYEDSKELQMVG